MWITKTAINNPVFATMVMVGLCVLGLFSYNRLGVEQLPDITTPTMTIVVQYPGASPEAVENDLTKPIENAVNTVSGVKTIRSNSFEGRSETYVEFRVGTDINRVIQDVRDKIAEIRPGFPREAKDPLVVRADSENQQPVVSLSVVSSTRDVRELTTLTDQVIVKELQKATGVGRVDYGGGRERQVQIRLHPERLAAFGVGVDQVLDAIRASNQDVAAGRIADAKSESLLRVEGKIKDVAGFGKIIVARRGPTGADAPVYLNQVADVIDGEEEAQTLARMNGKSSISIAVYKVQDANIVETGAAVKDALVNLKKRLPPGVEIIEIYANSDFVQDSLNGVKETLFEGGLLTVLIVFLFLRSWRSTVITGLTLPIAVISTFIALYAFGFTLNYMTMMALSLCIGLLIDDAIVVRENIVRHLRMGKGHRQAAEDGTNEIGLAVMATTFAIVAVFVPVAFMSGIIGKFFFSFGITVTVAVLVSLFVSFTLDPMLSSLWHDPADSRVLKFAPLRIVLDAFEHVVEVLHRIYGKLLGWALSGKLYRLPVPGAVKRLKVPYFVRATLGWMTSITSHGIVLWSAFLTFVFSIMLIAAGVIGSEFIPDVDQGFTSIRLTTPIGASLEYADQKTRQVEEILKTIPEIDLVDVNVFGEQRGTVRLNLKLTDSKLRKRTQKDIEQLIRDKLAPIPGIQMMIGFNTPIFLNVLGPDAEKINELAASLAADIGKIKGVVDLDTSNKPGTPALAIRLRPEVASDLGLDNQRVGNVLRPLVADDILTYWLAPDGQNYGVITQMPKTERTDATDIGNMMITTGRLNADGTPRLVPLRTVADIVSAESPQIIKRQDLQRRVGIYANVQGRPAGDVGADIKALVAKRVLPPGYRIVLSGQQQQQDESGAAAAGALALAVIFIYLILASQFGSFLQPVAIMASLPFSLIGVLLALLLTHTTLNLFSIIGFIMLMGLVTKNAILLVDFANHGQREGMSQAAALLEAGQVRLRPILMTTSAMVFGMMPLAIGLGKGSEQQSPMGRAIIGGVLTSTLLTLVVVPVIYSYVDRWGRRATAWFASAPARRAARAHKAGRPGGMLEGQPAAPVKGDLAE